MGKYVIAKCVCCGATRRIMAGEVKRGDVPICKKCYSPMVAEQACIDDEPVPKGENDE